MVIGGTLLSLGFFCFPLLDPLRDHIPFFLGVLAYQFVIFFALVFLLKRNPIKKERSVGFGVFVILFFALLFRFVLLNTSPTLSDDIYRYVWDGRVQQAGINPYVYPPAAPELSFLRDPLHSFINHPLIRTVYPPLAQGVFHVGVMIQSGIQLQRFLFLLFDIGTIFLLLWILRLLGRSVYWSLLYAWNPLVVVEFAGSGHFDSLMIFLMMFAFLLFQRQKQTWGTVHLSLAVLSKWVPIIMVPWVAIQKNWRRGLLFTAIILAGILPFLGGTTTLLPEGTQALSGMKTYTKDWVFNPSLYGLAGYVVPNPTAIKIFFGSILIVGALLWARNNKNNPTRYAFGCFYALLLASPVVHPWYVIWLVPFLCIYPLWSGLVWSAVVNLSYVVLIPYVTEGVWRLSPWVMWVEYTFVYGFLLFEMRQFWLEKLSRTPAATDSLQEGSPKQNQPQNVAIIIPAYNEERAIAKVIDEIPKTLVQTVILVDNGSKDQTGAQAKKAGARIVTEQKRGYGRAVLRGIEALPSTCDTVVILDGDHSDYPEDLPKLLDPLLKGEADMVIGSRTEAALPGSLTPQQRFGNWLTCLLMHQMYGVRFTDMGPFRAIRRRSLDQLQMKDKNFGWNVEMQIKALQKGIRVKEVPVRYRPRIGTSKISGTVKGTLMAGTIILWSLYRYGLKERN